VLGTDDGYSDGNTLSANDGIKLGVNDGNIEDSLL
jgi:hypothetical protein